MARLYHLRRGKKILGPLSPDKIKQMVTAGKVKASDLLRVEGGSNWVPARQIPSLATLFESAKGKAAAPTDNMLKKCRACANPVSREADKCPKCGHPTRRNQANQAIVAGCGVLLVALLIGGSFFFFGQFQAYRAHLGMKRAIGGRNADVPTFVDYLTGRRR